MAAEKIIKELGSSFPDHTITTQDYEPEFFALGYYSKPKRQHQNYMQPVYIAMFKSLGFAKWNHEIVIPATDPIYEDFSVHRKNPKFTKSSSK